MTVTATGVGKYDGDEWKVSPSQVNTWLECPRKWGYRYIEGIIAPPGVGAIRGQKVHAALESHFAGMETLDLDPKAYMKDPIRRMAQSMLSLLPNPNEVEATEQGIWFVFGGVVYRGYVDLQWWDHWPDHGAVLVVSDHKTSSDPVKYGLTATAMLSDTQCLTYGLWGLHHNKVPVVGLQWTYVNTRNKPKPFARQNVLMRGAADDRFRRRIHPVGLRIVDAIENVDKAADLEANPKACGNYGGCPHAEYCPRTIDETLTAALGEKQPMGKLKALLARAGQAPLKDKEAERERLASGEPGHRVNSPEAPANTDVARAVSEEVEQAPGGKAGKSRIAALAAAAAGSQTREEAKEAMGDATPSAPVGAPNGWDPSESPSQDQVLAWVCTTTFNKFVSQKAQATPDQPFAHGRTLGAMERNKLIFVHKLDGGVRQVLPTDTGREKYRAMDKSDVWVNASDAAPPEPAAQTIDSHEPVQVRTTVEQVGQGLAVAGEIIDGKLHLRIDLKQLGL